MKNIEVTTFNKGIATQASQMTKRTEQELTVFAMLCELLLNVQKCI
jgi:hypothetical protein